MLHSYQVVQYVHAQHRLDFDIYLFINTKSGGHVGMKFMTLEMETTVFVMHGLKISVSFYDQNVKSQRQAGLKRLKAAEQVGIKCRAIVCGGDGTVLWVVREMVDFGIRIHNVPIGVIPIGTGNDFSRVMGWGGKQAQLVGEKFNTLKQLVFEWIDAEVVNFDVWSFELDTHQAGYFKEISDKKQRVVNLNQIRRSFTNYCSVGIDGRIGWSFDKRRSESRAVNLLVYAWVGLLETCSPRIHLDRIIMSMEEISGVTSLMGNTNPPMRTFEEDLSLGLVNHALVPNGALRRQERYNMAKKSTIFSSQPNSPAHLKPSYQNIVALNIDSFMGGCHGIWQTTKSALTNTQGRVYLPQSYCDGILEFVAWESQAKLALQRMIHTSAKVAQGKGPFVMNFAPPQSAQDHIFCQVDGQFMKVYRPKQLIIERCNKIPDGYIRVLKYRGRKRDEFIGG